MDFIQTRLDLTSEEIRLVAELLGELNQAARVRCARSLKSSPGPHLSSDWAQRAKVFEGFDFNSKQEGQVLRKAANEKARYLAGQLGEMPETCKAKIAKKKAEIAYLRKNPMGSRGGASAEGAGCSCRPRRGSLASLGWALPLPVWICQYFNRFSSRLAGKAMSF
jgi:hypothetical protein